MEEMYGLHPTCDVSPEILMISEDYNQYDYRSLIHSADHLHRTPVFGPDELGFQCSSGESAPVVGDEDEDKAKISSHPSFSKLLDAYIDCQKVGAPPEIVCLLDEIRRENDLCKQDTTLSMVDPQLDHFMETYCNILVKYKSDLSRPFDEATSFLTQIQTQFLNLCNVSSDEEIEDALTKSDDRQRKEKLLRLYGSHISSLRLEFSKKKKKGKLPKEACQTLLTWWNLHPKWPYPTEADKTALAESTGLDQKQINNWFINQRKRHWKLPQNMQLD